MTGNAGEKVHEKFKVNGEYENTPDKDVVGLPYLDEYIEKAGMEFLDWVAKSGKPFFIRLNFIKVHQPNLLDPDFMRYAPPLSELPAQRRRDPQIIPGRIDRGLGIEVLIQADAQV